MKNIFLLILIIFTSNLHAEFVPSQDKIKLVKDIEKGKTSSYRWLHYNIESNPESFHKIKNSKASSYLILDSIEKRGNSFMVASNVVNLKANKTIYLYNWLSVNCDTNTVKDFGSISDDGVFAKIPPTIAPIDTTWHSLTAYFCGRKYENKLYFNYLINFHDLDDNNNFTRYAYTADENYDDGNYRNLIWIAPVLNSSSEINGFNGKGKLKVDCVKESIFDDLNKEFLASDPGSVSFFIVKQVCDSSIPFYRGDKFLPQVIQNNDIKVDEGFNLEEIKKECEKLGFKKDTKKFKECQVELIE